MHVWSQKSIQKPHRRRKRLKWEGCRAKVTKWMKEQKAWGGKDEDEEEEKCLFFAPTPFSSIALHAPFPSGQPGGQAGHRRPSFPSPCWPCCSFQTQSSSSGRTSAQHDTKEGWTRSVWRPGTRSPSTPRTSWTEDSLTSTRRLFFLSIGKYNCNNYCWRSEIG